jgi:hypothetical protein
MDEQIREGLKLELDQSIPIIRHFESMVRPRLRRIVG